MGRFPQRVCLKGSQRWIQWFVNHAPHEIDQQIGLGAIEWRSPLRDDAYAEYRDAAFLRRVGVDLSRRSLVDFWPRGGPQWDALGRAETGEVVIVEAKAHLNELYSPATMASESSLPLIRASLAEAAQAMGVQPGFDWSKRFYQYANRLAHAYLLHVVNGIPTKLVFVYFSGDTDVAGPQAHDKWAKAIHTVHTSLGLSTIPTYVKQVFVDVSLGARH